MDTYHLRRPEQAIADPAEMQAIIESQKYMTLALCRENEPYLVTVNYAYDADERCFFLHCAPRGKKMDYWRANPVVWGQVMSDDGYCDGECNHAYRSVHFRGLVEFVEEREAKKQALYRLIDRLESDPGATRQRLVNDRSVDCVAVVRVRVVEMSGKRNPAPR